MRAVRIAGGLAAVAVAAGCTFTHELKPGGVFHTESTCRKSDGATFDRRSVSDGTQQDMRHHLEGTRPDPATGKLVRVLSDIHTVEVGPCPPDLKPGQTRGPDGKISEMAGAAVAP
jgi:hypothetical protein